MNSVKVDISHSIRGVLQCVLSTGERAFLYGS